MKNAQQTDRVASDGAKKMNYWWF